MQSNLEMPETGEDNMDYEPNAARSHLDQVLGNRVFITGGTGSLGSRLTRYILENSNATVVCYSRDPHKQNDLLASVENKKNLRLVLGDIRDKERLSGAMRGASTVVHTAALKHVDLGEYNYSEFIKVNVDGTQNVVDVAIRNGVRKVLFISSDKAPSAMNLYGKTKSLAESFVIRSNAGGRGKTKLSVIRYGNVFDSRGNVVTVWKDRLARGLPIVVREPEPTRYICLLRWGVQWVLSALEMMHGGEIFVPADLKAISIHDLAMQFSPRDYWQVVPLGGGEKQHEVLLAPEELRNTVAVDRFWIINPVDPQWKYELWQGERPDFKSTSSGTAEKMPMNEFLSLIGE